MLQHATEALKILGGIGLFFSFTEVSSALLVPPWARQLSVSPPPPRETSLGEITKIPLAVALLSYCGRRYLTLNYLFLSVLYFLRSDCVHLKALLSFSFILESVVPQTSYW